MASLSDEEAVTGHGEPSLDAEAPSHTMVDIEHGVGESSSRNKSTNDSPDCVDVSTAGPDPVDEKEKERKKSKKKKEKKKKKKKKQELERASTHSAVSVESVDSASPLLMNDRGSVVDDAQVRSGKQAKEEDTSETYETKNKDVVVPNDADQHRDGIGHSPSVSDAINEQASSTHSSSSQHNVDVVQNSAKNDSTGPNKSSRTVGDEQTEDGLLDTMESGTKLSRGNTPIVANRPYENQKENLLPSRNIGSESVRLMSTRSATVRFQCFTIGGLHYLRLDSITASAIIYRCYLYVCSCCLIISDRTIHHLECRHNEL